MRSLTLFLISIFLIVPSLSAATVSGEIGSVSRPTTTPAVSNSTQTQYFSGLGRSCYILIKNKRTGKVVKRLVARKYCIKR